MHKSGASGQPKAGPRSVPVTMLWVLLVVVGCESLRQRAHRENEHGITLDDLGRHSIAHPFYERSRAYGVKPQVPTYNLARSHALAGDHAEAHRLYQEALELSPEFTEAFYNDGVSLFRWGEAERDPRGCQLERTLDLWRNARRRFITARQLAEGTDLEAQAEANSVYVGERVEEVQELIRNPPPECLEPPPPPPPSPNEGQGGGGGEPPPEPPPSGGGEPPPEPPPSGGQDPPPDPPPEPPPEPPPAGGGGQTPPPPGSDPEDPSQGGGGGLSQEEQEEIQQALARIEEQRQEDGKFHRRSLPEQFPKEAWENPQVEIWW